MYLVPALLIIVLVYTILRLGDRANGERIATNEKQREKRRSMHLQIAILSAIAFTYTSFMANGQSLLN